MSFGLFQRSEAGSKASMITSYTPSFSGSLNRQAVLGGEVSWAVVLTICS